MMKFYRQEARRILAGQKKLSTILITCEEGSRFLEDGNLLTAKRMAEKPHGVGKGEDSCCGKAEDRRG
jgi:hypothetical protein